MEEVRVYAGARCQLLSRENNAPDLTEWVREQWHLCIDGLQRKNKGHPWSAGVSQAGRANAWLLRELAKANALHQLQYQALCHSCCATLFQTNRLFGTPLLKAFTGLP